MGEMRFRFSLPLRFLALTPCATAPLAGGSFLGVSPVLPFSIRYFIGLRLRSSGTTLGLLPR
jgi:hypothetical protein